MGKDPVPVLAQYEWRWYEDDAAEPTAALAAQEVAPTLASDTDIIRLRINLSETGGGTVSDIVIRLQWSTDESTWWNFVAGDWAYADGQATHGNLVTSFLLDGTDTAAEYVEVTGGTGTFDIAPGEDTEWDFAIVPDSPDPGTTYYFRVLVSNVAIALGGNQTHASLTTYTAPAAFTPKITVT